MNTFRCARGLTLIELMVVVSVLGIILAVGIPSFTTLIENNRMTTTTNDLNGTLQYARSEAVRRAEGVTVTVAGAGVTVTAVGGNVLRILKIDQGNITLAAVAGTAAAKVVFIFNARGESNKALTLGLCDDRKGNYGRQLQLLVSGAMRLSTGVECNSDA